MGDHLTSDELRKRNYEEVLGAWPIIEIEKGLEICLGKVTNPDHMVIIYNLPFRSVAFYVPKENLMGGRPATIAEKVHLKVRGDTEEVRGAGKRLVGAVNARPKSDVSIGGWDPKKHGFDVGRHRSR